MVTNYSRITKGCRSHGCRCCRCGSRTRSRGRTRRTFASKWGRRTRSGTGFATYRCGSRRHFYGVSRTGAWWTKGYRRSGRGDCGRRGRNGKRGRTSRSRLGRRGGRRSSCRSPTSCGGAGRTSWRGNRSIGGSGGRGLSGAWSGSATGRSFWWIHGGKSRADASASRASGRRYRCGWSDGGG